MLFGFLIWLCCFFMEKRIVLFVNDSFWNGWCRIMIILISNWNMKTRNDVDLIMVDQLLSFRSIFLWSRDIALYRAFYWSEWKKNAWREQKSISKTKKKGLPKRRKNRDSSRLFPGILHPLKTTLFPQLFCIFAFHTKLSFFIILIVKVLSIKNKNALYWQAS